jgi:hypothetical protein
MSSLMRFPSAVRRDPGIDAWFAAHDEQRWAAQPWFERMRACGVDVRELMHDHCPTACVEDAAFAYVGAYAAHVSVGFFNGSALKDPAGLLEGAGKRMRHVKIRPGRPVDAGALNELIAASYRDMRMRLKAD